MSRWELIAIFCVAFLMALGVFNLARIAAEAGAEFRAHREALECAAK